MAGRRLGMDVGRMEDLQRQVKNEADKVNEIIAALEREVREVDWHGPDANQFKNSEWSAAKADLQKVARSLEDTGQKLKRNIAQQRSASAR